MHIKPVKGLEQQYDETCILNVSVYKVENNWRQVKTEHKEATPARGCETCQEVVVPCTRWQQPI